jgi:regulator of RNase E activity RraB
MTYEEFKAEMQNLLNLAFKYDVEQAGFAHYTEKMAALADEHPEYDLMLEDETL